MPVRKPKIHHRNHHEKHKRTKKFLKVYAPYIPLLLILGSTLALAFSSSRSTTDSSVLSYATNMSHQGLLDSTNKQRVEKGVGALALDNTLNRAAQQKAEDMVKRNYWSHDTPDGKQPWYFFEKAGYPYFKAAENLAYGFDSSEGAVSGWMNSPSHRQNLLDKSLIEVGFGIANAENYNGSGPQTVVVAMYGLPASEGGLIPVASAGGDETAPTELLAKNEEKISYAQALTGGKAPWITFISGLIIGSILMFLSFKHLRQLRRVVIASERYVVKHPVLDVTLIALLALAAVMSKTAGIVH